MRVSRGYHFIFLHFVLNTRRIRTVEYYVLYYFLLLVVSVHFVIQSQVYVERRDLYRFIVLIFLALHFIPGSPTNFLLTYSASWTFHSTNN